MPALKEKASSLLSVTTLALNAAADTTIYTVPSGKRCVLHYAVLVATSFAGTTQISIGANGSETDFVQTNTLDGLDIANDAVIIQPVPSATPSTLKSYAGGTVIQAQITNNSGAAVNHIYLYGSLY